MPELMEPELLQTSPAVVESEPVTDPEPDEVAGPLEGYLGPAFDPDDQADVYLPTQEEIRAACAEFQAGWSRDEERRRRTWSLPRRIDYGRIAKIEP